MFALKASKLSHQRGHQASTYALLKMFAFLQKSET
jgi:hypothetical protein